MENHFKGKWVFLLCRNGTAIGRILELNSDARTATVEDCHYFSSNADLVRKEKMKGSFAVRYELAITGPDKYVKKVYPPIGIAFVTDIGYMAVLNDAAQKAWLGRPVAVCD